MKANAATTFWRAVDRELIQLDPAKRVANGGEIRAVVCEKEPQAAALAILVKRRTEAYRLQDQNGTRHV